MTNTRTHVSVGPGVADVLRHHNGWSRSAEQLLPMLSSACCTCCSDAIEVQMRYASVTESVISEYRARAQRWATFQLGELAASCGPSPGQYTGHVAYGSPARELDHHEDEHDPT